MRVITGTVVGGMVVIEGDALVEGTRVTVLAPDDSASFEASPAEEEALLAAIAEADRGELVPADQVLADLRRTG